QPPQEEDSLSSPETTSDTEEDLQRVEAWIQARKNFRRQLESLGDVEKWLSHKPSLSKIEERYLQRIKAGRAESRAAVKAAKSKSLDHLLPKSSQPRKKCGIPLVFAPYPQALVTLHNLLNEKKLTMVEVFQKAGMEKRKIKRADFIKVIKETKVPISNKDLEDAVIFLTSSKPGDFISYKDLTDCQKQWLEKRKGQSQETKTVTFKSATCSPAAGDRAKGMKPQAPTKPERKLITLEVPPVNTEPERRHVTYDEMEEIGKHSRERKRPIEWKEKCRMVRSGDSPVDKHCLPSTLKTAWGEQVDQYRRNTVMCYLNTPKMCKERGVHIRETTLQKALLHPGDRIIKEGEDIRKIRQPGGYYSTGRADAPSPGSQAREAKKRVLQGNSQQQQRGRSSSQLRGHSCVLAQHLQKNKMQKSNDNNFWPGHLLDKLCLYFPEKQHDRAHALFSCVRPTKPAY
ncbi:EFC12 protein, partial [Nyctiprogne leucopyga]|nr:EFC12 protein [Nyctiprogne leucopyga]